MNPKTIPVRETAERLGISRQRVHMLIRSGKLREGTRRPIPGRKGHREAVWVTVASIEKLEHQRWLEHRAATVSTAEVMAASFGEGRRDV